MLVPNPSNSVIGANNCTPADNTDWGAEATDVSNCAPADSTMWDGNPDCYIQSDSLTALLALGTPGCTRATTKGYYNLSDVGGGDYYWDADSTADDDGGAVLTPTGHAGAGRWVRQFEDIRPEFWGAVRDQVTDDSAAIQSAMDYAKSVGSNEVKLDPRMGYGIRYIRMRLGVKLTGPVDRALNVLPYAGGRDWPGAELVVLGAGSGGTSDENILFEAEDPFAGIHNVAIDARLATGTMMRFEDTDWDTMYSQRALNECRNLFIYGGAGGGINASQVSIAPFSKGNQFHNCYFRGGPGRPGDGDNDPNDFPDYGVWSGSQDCMFFACYAYGFVKAAVHEHGGSNRYYMFEPQQCMEAAMVIDGDPLLFANNGSCYMTDCNFTGNGGTGLIIRNAGRIAGSNIRFWENHNDRDEPDMTAYNCQQGIMFTNVQFRGSLLGNTENVNCAEDLGSHDDGTLSSVSLSDVQVVATYGEVCNDLAKAVWNWQNVQRGEWIDQISMPPTLQNDPTFTGWDAGAPIGWAVIGAGASTAEQLTDTTALPASYTSGARLTNDETVDATLDPQGLLFYLAETEEDAKKFWGRRVRCRWVCRSDGVSYAAQQSVRVSDSLTVGGGDETQRQNLGGNGVMVIGGTEKIIREGTDHVSVRIIVDEVGSEIASPVSLQLDITAFRIEVY